MLTRPPGSDRNVLPSNGFPASRRAGRESSPDLSGLKACLVSHQLGGTDGVSVEAEKWERALRSLGCQVTRAAGRFLGHKAGDVIIAGMWAEVAGGRPPPADVAAITRLCQEHDLLVLDNAATLWSAPEAAQVWRVQALAAGVPTIVRHHDPPWQAPPQRPIPADILPITDPHFVHVCINELTRKQFAGRWPELAVEVLHNTVDRAILRGGNRVQTRARLGAGSGDLLIAHPARLVPRKNVAGAVKFAQALDQAVPATVRYWLTDNATHATGEDAIALAAAQPKLIRGPVARQADLYAAADLVVLPSTWEGWGLPVVEAAVAERLVVAGPYAVLDEIRAAGLTVFDPSQIDEVAALLRQPTALERLLAHNSANALRHFTFEHLPQKLMRLYYRAQALAHPEVNGLEHENHCIAATTNH